MKTNNEIILIFPRESNIAYKKSYRESAQMVENAMKIAKQKNYEVFREPLGIESIASYLRINNYLVKMFFCEMEDVEDETIYNYIINNNIKFIGVSVLFDRHLQHAITLSKKLRNINTNIFLGGAFASFAASELVEKIDWISGVLIGEGEKTVLNVVEKIYKGEEWRSVKGICYYQKDEGAVFTDSADKLDINNLPSPDRDFLEMAVKRGYNIRTASIYTSRGCAQACTFCTGNEFAKLNKGKIWRYRTAEVVVNEIEMLVKKYDINYFYICDDNFFGYGSYGKDRIFNIIRKLKEKEIKVRFHFEMRVDMVTDELLRMCKESGFVDIFLGIESGVQSMLNRWKKSSTVEQNLTAIKLVRKNGLNLNPGFILFDEKTTYEELKENLMFIKKAELDSSEYIFDLFNPMQIFRGSNLQKSGNYKYIEKIDDSEDEIKKLVLSIAYYDYEIRDIRVLKFWESVKTIIDETNFYFNYFIIPNIYKNKTKYNKKKLVIYLSQFKKMKNDMGKILMDISFYAINIVNEIKDIEKMKNAVRNYYTNIEKTYFKDGIKKGIDNVREYNR